MALNGCAKVVVIVGSVIKVIRGSRGLRDSVTKYPMGRERLIRSVTWQYFLKFHAVFFLFFNVRGPGLGGTYQYHQMTQGGRIYKNIGCCRLRIQDIRSTLFCFICFSLPLSVLQRDVKVFNHKCLFENQCLFSSFVIKNVWS